MSKFCNIRKFLNFLAEIPEFRKASMLSVVSPLDTVWLLVAQRDPFLRIFGIHQRLYRYLYICRYICQSWHSIRILTARKALLSYFEGKHILFWTSSIASFDGMYSIFCSDARASYASLPQCSLFPFSLLSCGPFLYFGSTAASLKWFFSRRCFSWFSLDSKNSDRALMWKVRMVRSLADRTFRPRQRP